MNDEGELCKLCQLHQNVVDDTSSECDTESSMSKCENWLEKCRLHAGSDASSELGSSIFDDSNLMVDDHMVNDCQEQILSDFSGKIKDYKTPLATYKNIVMKDCKVVLGTINKLYGEVNLIKNESNTVNNIFLNGMAEMVPTKNVNIVSRINWVAQPPIEPPTRLQSPAKLVIISHTATDHAKTQAENVLLVRNIQTFHIESRKWNDIAYNYLVGCDGKTYKGRGWGIVGAHTKGYNNISVGISFIGCFLTSLPSESALHQAKALIKLGVEVGAVDKDYILVGHCQCCPTESPGKRLFEEIKTWDHWKSSIPDSLLTMC